MAATWANIRTTWGSIRGMTTLEELAARVDRLEREVQELKHGGGMRADLQVGYVITDEARERWLARLAETKARDSTPEGRAARAALLAQIGFDPKPSQ